MLVFGVYLVHNRWSGPEEDQDAWEPLQTLREDASQSMARVHREAPRTYICLAQPRRGHLSHAEARGLLRRSHGLIGWGGYSVVAIDAAAAAAAVV